MEKSTFEIHHNLIKEEAHRYFLKSAGLTDDSDKSKRMLMDATKIKNEIEKSLEIKVAISFFNNFEIHEDTLTFERVSFKCNPFSLLSKKNILGVYLYIITAGDHYSQDSGLLGQLYADLWTTSYLDAGRNALKEILIKDYYSKISEGGNTMEEGVKPVTITDSFGPGFYGMDPMAIMKIFRLVDSAGIGVECNESGMMSPVQTCTGIFLLIEGETLVIAEECETCLGSRLNCNLCQVKGK